MIRHSRSTTVAHHSVLDISSCSPTHTTSLLDQIFQFIGDQPETAVSNLLVGHILILILNVMIIIVKNIVLYSIKLCSGRLVYLYSIVNVKFCNRPAVCFIRVF